MHQKQKGISFIGFVFVMVVLVFFVLVGLRLFPIYQEYYGVVQAMKGVAAQPGISQESPSQVRTLLMRRFDVNYIDSVKKEHISVTRNPGYSVTVKYEVRRPLFGNLDVVASFDKSVSLLGP